MIPEGNPIVTDLCLVREFKCISQHVVTVHEVPGPNQIGLVVSRTKGWAFELLWGHFLDPEALYLLLGCIGRWGWALGVHRSVHFITNQSFAFY